MKPSRWAMVARKLIRSSGVLMRAAVLATAICLSIIGVSLAEDAGAAIRKPTNIPAQTLGSALEALAKAYDIQLIYRSEVVGGLHTHGAVGDLTAEEALKELLGGTGLVYRYLNEKTVTIVPSLNGTSGLDRLGNGYSANAEGSQGGSGTSFGADSRNAGTSEEVHEGAGTPPTRMRLAQAGQQSHAGGDAQTPQSSTLETITVTAAKVRALDQFTPTGSRLGLTALETPGSLDVIDSDEMLGRGFNSVEEAADSLPGVTSGGSPGDLEQFSMRGFTGDQILSLYNGLYIGPANITNRPQNTFNLESVEILKGPASVLYGQGAVAGAVNVVSKGQ